jgi:HK97 family phage prohead protease
MSVDLGGFREIIAPGAFAESLTGDVLLLRDHVPALLMGRTKSGTLTLADTADGLNFNCKLPGTTSASDLAESIERGDLDGVSFGFICRDDKWAAADDGNVIRTVVSAELIEISPCSLAAYPANSVSVRSCPAEYRSMLKRSDNDQCQCACPECAAGNCAECSDPDCGDENCRCAQRGNALSDSERNRMAMRLKLKQA